jgi:threonine/homoserine/homoserine lactone efflux protein
MQKLFTKDKMTYWGAVLLGLVLMFMWGSQDAAVSGNVTSVGFVASWAGAAMLVYGAYKLVKSMGD